VLRRREYIRLGCRRDGDHTTQRSKRLFAFNMLFSNVFLPTALLAAQAAAHGAVTSYVIDGVTYPG